MKKLIALLLVLFLIVGLAACGGSTPDPTPAPPADTPPADTPADPPADGGDLRIGLSMGERDEWLTYLENGIVARAAEVGVELVAQDAQRDINRQLDHIQTFAAQGFDAIIVCLVDPAFSDALVEAGDGLPVIFVNRIPQAHVLEFDNVSFSGSDETEAGGFQAQYLSELFAGETELDYVLFMGIIGHPATTYRTSSFREGMEAAGFTLNNVFADSANFDRAEALNRMQQFLGTGIHFDFVVSNNDEMALGVIEALRAVDMLDIPVVGIDGSPHAVASILAGEMNASVFQNAAAQGATALDLAVAMARGESVQSINMVPFELVTSANAAQYQ